MFSSELCQATLSAVIENVRGEEIRTSTNPERWSALIGTSGSQRMIELLYTRERRNEVERWREHNECRDLCPEGHTSPPSRYCPRRQGRDGGWAAGRRCSVCVSSRWERIIYALVQMVGLETTKHYIGQTKNAAGGVIWQGHELDIYMPDVKKAIEYNGQQHYERGFFTPDITKRLLKDQEKLFSCHRAGVKLLFVRYDDPQPVQTVLEFLQK
jgi:hypothetical protein